ncbi:MAG: tRNA uridine-5-carboxymethylaminomethyl(34) synthesis GTPase MnmE [Xanthobacteraceae bacterium]
MIDQRDTIFALSSGRPPAAIAVVRMSGPQAGNALRALIGRLPAPREAVLARVRDPGNGEIIDDALALWFPGPKSVTGEDVAELHVHGGRAVVAAVLAALGRLPRCRPAEAGEFTRRAFDNGKLDLTRVEGLADLIAADAEAQRRQALRQLRGLLSDRAEAWRTALIAALALVEARIDFSDEGDVPEDLITPALAAARALRDEIAAALSDQRRGERLREGLVVAIAGPPNAGKSSLINRIARREAAIVSPYAGTTRDVIEVHLDLGGAPVTLLDTAGIRESEDPVEQEGVRRARARAAEADLVLWVVDAAAKAEATLGDKQAPAEGASKGEQGNGKPSCWTIVNKIDLGAGVNEPASLTKNESVRSFAISARTGEGLVDLLDALEGFAADVIGGGEPVLITRERHRLALQETVAALDRALAEPPADREEIVAEELRLAARALGRLVGRVDVEDVLDVIFRDFCIGK